VKAEALGPEGLDVSRIDRQRLFGGRDGPLDRLRAGHADPVEENGLGLEGEVVSGEVSAFLAAHPLDLGHLDLRRDGGHDIAGDVLLKVEEVIELAVVALGPNMAPGLAVDQLGRDPDPFGGSADATFEDETNPELLGNPPHVDRLALVGEGRVAGDDEEARKARQLGDDIFGNPIGEVVLLRVAGHIRERQDSDGGLVGKRQGPRQSVCPARLYAGRSQVVDPHGLGDVLHPPLAHVLECSVQLALDHVEGRSGKAEATGFGEGLQAGGHVDAIAIDVRALDHDVAQVDADAQDDAAVVGQLGVPALHCLLNIDRALHRLDHARELGQQAVAHELHDAPAAFGDLRLHQVPAERLEALQGTPLVGAHEARIADHVCSKDGGKPAFQTLSPSLTETSGQRPGNPCGRRAGASRPDQSGTPAFRRAARARASVSGSRIGKPRI
jgi:hypothetical protein